MPKPKHDVGWRWSETEETMFYSGGATCVAIDERALGNERVIFRAYAVHEATHRALDDRIEELGTFDDYRDAYRACEERVGEPLPEIFEDAP